MGTTLRCTTTTIFGDAPPRGPSGLRSSSAYRRIEDIAVLRQVLYLLGMIDLDGNPVEKKVK